MQQRIIRIISIIILSVMLLGFIAGCSIRFCNCNTNEKNKKELIQDADNGGINIEFAIDDVITE